MTLILHLPVAPSENHYRRVIPGRSFPIISADGRAYKRAVAAACLAQGIRQPLTERLSMIVVMNFPDKRRRDLSNYLKALEDAMKGCAFLDDSQIDRAEQIRGGTGKDVAGFTVTLQVIEH